MFVLASAALHTVPFFARPPRAAFPPIDVTLNPAVEFGLEAPPAPPPPAAPPALPAAAPERPAVPVERPRPAPRRERPLPLPDPPSVNLREPALAGTLEPPSLRDAAVPDEAAVALADASVPDEAAVALADASVPDEAAVALADASVAPPGVPGLAGAAPDLVGAIPSGAAVTMLLRMDRLRANPNGARVAAMLRAIPDWQALLDGTELDPVRDFDAVLLATSQLFFRRGQAPDITAVIRTHTARSFLRASVEQMAGARPPSTGDPDAGTLRDRLRQRDAGALPAASRAVWRRQGAAEVAQIDRYIGPQTVMLLPDDLVLIAPPARVPTLLAMLRSPQGQAIRARAAGDAQDLVALMHGEGLRRMLRGPATLIPLRGELGIFETRSGGAADGGARVLLRADFDDARQAAAAARVMRGILAAARDQIATARSSPMQVLGAAAVGVSLSELDDAVEAFGARDEGAVMVLEARLTASQVAQLLRAQALAGLFGG
ncbi:MAG: hypothetical protein R3A48_08140 [Polyangiales bacterium]